MSPFANAIVASHRHVLRLRILVPLAVISTIYLYLFPVFHGCAFPLPPEQQQPRPPQPPPPTNDGALRAFLETAALHVPAAVLAPRRPRAPFRLLALGDPQLEGDTSIPNYYGPPLPHLWALLSDVTFRADHPSLRERVRHAVHEFVDVFLDDAPMFCEGIRKRIDLAGNDLYLAHNFRTLHWWAAPTHVSVLGDLLGSQWIDDREFARRGRRFWDVVMRGTERVPDELAMWPRDEYDLSGVLGIWDAGGSRGEPGEGTRGEQVAQATDRRDTNTRVADTQDTQVTGMQDMQVTDAQVTGAQVTDTQVTDTQDTDTQDTDTQNMQESKNKAPASKTPAAWTRRSINVAGNHDIGYAGDLDENRLARFERLFGKANYELRFGLPVADAALNATFYDPDANPTSTRLPPEIRVVVVNDMNLDTPALSKPLQDATYRFINAVISTSHAVELRGVFTLVLTHIPLHKPEGVCVDAPFFDFFPSNEGGGVREQNLLSLDASKGFLEGIFGLSGDVHAAAAGMGRRGIIVNGHDHAGCDTYHFINQSVPSANRTWEVRRWEHARGDAGVAGTAGVPGVREITARSMMGDFGGHVGMLSVWFDEDAWEWRAEYATCAMGTQHGWWLVHMLDGLVVLFVLARLAKLTGLDPGRAAADRGQRAWNRACEATENAVDWAVETAAEGWRARKARRVAERGGTVGQNGHAGRGGDDMKGSNRDEGEHVCYA